MKNKTKNKNKKQIKFKTRKHQVGSGWEWINKLRGRAQSVNLVTPSNLPQYQRHTLNNQPNNNNNNIESFKDRNSKTEFTKIYDKQFKIITEDRTNEDEFIKFILLNVILSLYPSLYPSLINSREKTFGEIYQDSESYKSIIISIEESNGKDLLSNFIKIINAEIVDEVHKIETFNKIYENLANEMLNSARHPDDVLTKEEKEKEKGEGFVFNIMNLLSLIYPELVEINVFKNERRRNNMIKRLKNYFRDYENPDFNEQHKKTKFTQQLEKIIDDAVELNFSSQSQAGGMKRTRKVKRTKSKTKRTKHHK